MTELNVSGSSHQKGPGVKKGKKLSTRVDLTPMVDLGFLLITFFIFTTTLSQPTTMKLILPKDTDDSNKIKLKFSAVLTIMLSKNDLVYYYEGDDPTKLKFCNFKVIRNVILDKKRRTDPKYLEIIIKPSSGASYRNTVDMLDEMTIDAINHSALVDISPVEAKMIQETEKANGII